MKISKPVRLPVAFGGDGWNIIQRVFDENIKPVAETVFNQGNGYLGVRGFFEDEPAGAGGDGTFLTGLYELQAGRTQHMKGKSVLPDDFCRAAIAFNCFSFDILGFDGASCEIISQERTLNLATSELQRTAVRQFDSGQKIQTEFKRIVVRDEPDTATARYSIKSIDFDGVIKIISWLDADVSSYILGKGMWADIEMNGTPDGRIEIVGRTRRSKLWCIAASTHEACMNKSSANIAASIRHSEKRIGVCYELRLAKGQEYCIEKNVCIKWEKSKPSSYHDISKTPYNEIFGANLEKMKAAWGNCDVAIEGDELAQQGIRFCISQLMNAYREGLENSVTAKGLTGEGYGQLCFWDSEIYLLPFYIYTQPKLARDILMFRYRILDAARERAELLGYKGAFFPWMTVNGEDNPAVWECVLGEQHINAAVPYAIEHYVKATGDEEFLRWYGAEIVIENARFWTSRVYLRPDLGKYVINQVTGPDEYMEMVNNNCYTNMMAAWTLAYASGIVAKMQNDFPETWELLKAKIRYVQAEAQNWDIIAKKMYIPFDERLKINPQDDTFLGQDHLDLVSLSSEDFPLESKWPWLKVLQYDALKQPDVVLLNFLLNDRFSCELKKANYQYYEPRTTHDSSLSPSIHSIMASEIGAAQDAYDYFMYSARLDLDYGTPSDGVHLANAGGAWMAMVNGFAGLRWIADTAYFSPAIPSCWRSYSFGIWLRGRAIRITVGQDRSVFQLEHGSAMIISINGTKHVLTYEVEVPTRILDVRRTCE